jgi:hypothetical protein
MYSNDDEVFMAEPEVNAEDSPGEVNAEDSPGEGEWVLCGNDCGNHCMCVAKSDMWLRMGRRVNSSMSRSM